MWHAVVAGVGLTLLFVVGTSPAPHDSSATQYRSTDFEVHRYWTAVTGRLPLHEWYTANHSIWTLDYPPLFAYLEYGLAHTYMRLHAVCGEGLAVASSAGALFRVPGVPGQFENPVALLRRAACSVVDDALLDVEAASPFSSAIATFQRTTVVLVSFLPFVLAVAWTARRLGLSRSWWWVLALAAHPGILLLDHVHFQYNGTVFALALLSIGLAASGRNVLAGAVYFVLLCTKHLFAYYGLGFAVWGLALLAAQPTAGRAIGLCVRFGLAAAAVALVAFGPLIASYANAHEGTSTFEATMAVLSMVRARLFPFGRGLCHAYWAPNIYPLYNVVDRVLLRALGLRDVDGDVAAAATSVNTRGHVGLVVGPSEATGASQRSHAVLPSITPGVSLLIVVVLFAVFLFVFASRSTPVRLAAASAGGDDRQQGRRHLTRLLLMALFASSSAFFLASWHVHEKALLTVAFPALLLAATGNLNARGVRAAVFLSFLASAAVAPLFFTTRECVLKYAAIIAHDCLLQASLSFHHRDHQHHPDDEEEEKEGGDSTNGATGRVGYAAARVLVLALSLAVDWNAMGARAGAREDRFAPLMLYSVATSVMVMWAVCCIARNGRRA